MPNTPLTMIQIVSAAPFTNAGIATPVDCGESGSTVTNAGTVTCYYSDELPVSTSSPSLAAGVSVSLAGTYYFHVFAVTSPPSAQTTVLKILRESPDAASGTGFGLPQSPYDRIDDGSERSVAYNHPTALNATAALTTPTYDGAGEAVHPDVVYYPRKWNGWHYWMLFEPYPNADATKENPSILVSNDGDTWQVPTGLTNPVVAAPGGSVFNSDGCLVKSLDGLTLHMVYRVSGGGSDSLQVRSSTDGITWTPAAEMLTGATSTLASPSIAYWRGAWHMWYCDVSSGAGAGCIVKHTSTAAGALTGPWATADNTNLTGSTPGGLVNKSIWHLQVLANGEKLQMLLYATGAAGNTLHYGTSSDGLTWTMAAQPVLAGISGGWDESMYRGCMVPASEPGEDYLDVFYSARTSAGNGVWHIGRSRIDFRRPLRRQRVGRWTDAPTGGTRTTQAFAINELRAVPFEIQAMMLTGIAIEVTSGAAAGSIFRYGLYLDDGEGAPGRLLKELGTFDTTSTGVKAATGLYIPVPTGTLWLAGRSEVSPPTIKVINGDGGSNVEAIPGLNAANALGVGRAAYLHATNGSGALPSTFDIGSVTGSQYGPRFAVLLEKK